mgnify:CR=1 FL=1
MKSIYYYLLFLGFWFSSFSSHAQQMTQQTQYVGNNFLLNPAIAGIESYLDLRTSYKTQWVGSEGAPTSFYTSVHSSIDRNGSSGNNLSSNNGSSGQYGSALPHHGYGAIIQMNKAGLFSILSFNLNYAYHIPLTGTLNMSAGISTGLKQYRLNRDKLDVLEPNDELLTGDASQKITPDLGIGFWIYSKNYYLGLSGLQLLRNKSDNGTTEPNASSMPNFYATAGLRIHASDLLSISPSMMVKTTENGQVKVDANTKLTYNQFLWLGASYRHKDALAGTLGTYLSHMLDVSYTYNIATSELNQISANSHEVVVGIKLNNRQKIRSPQWTW